MKTHQTTLLALVLAAAALGQGLTVKEARPMNPFGTSASRIYYRLEFDQEVDTVDGALTLVGIDQTRLDGTDHVSAKFSTTTTHAFASVSGFPDDRFTLELWVKTGDGGGTLVGYSTGALDNEAIRLSDPDALDLRVANQLVIQNAANIADNQWHHVVATWRSSTGAASIIIDGGTPITGNGAQGAVLGTSGTLALMTGLGVGGVPNGSTVVGNADELRIWPSLRTTAQLNNNRHRPLGPGAIDGTSLYWPIQDKENLGLGTSGINDVRDLSPNGNHGAFEPVGPPLEDAPAMSDEYRMASVRTAGVGCTQLIGLDVEGSITLAAGGAATVPLFAGERFVYHQPQPNNPGVDLTGLSTSSVSCIPGQTIQLNGSGFFNTSGNIGPTVNTVLFGVTPATSVSVSGPNTVVAGVPVDLEIGVAHRVAVYGNCSDVGWLDDAFTLTLLPPGSIGGIAPTGGSCAGGDSVTITGSGFRVSGETMIETVRFGGIDAPSFTVVNSTTITATTPPMPPNAALDVTVSGTCYPEASFSSFNTTPELATATSISPDQGACGGGEPVTITGSGFRINGNDQVEAVLFDGVPGTGLTVLSATTLEVVTPALTSPTAVDVTLQGTCIPTVTMPAAYTPLMLFQVPGDYPTIQQALDAACDGTIVELAPGTYAEVLDFHGLNITLRGTQAPGDTLVVGTGDKRLIVDAGAGSRVQDLTLSDGVGSGSGGGGAVQVDTGGGPTVVFRNVIFEDNATPNSGGAVQVISGTVRFANCEFRNNDAIDDGGAIAASGATTVVEMVNCRLIGNTAGADGGGVFVGAGAGATLVYSTFLDNSAGGDNGGVRGEGATDVRSCVLWDNAHGGPAGGTQLGGPAITAEDSSIEGGYTGAGNSGADPMFLDAEGRVHRLSPLVDAGGSAAGIAMPSTDVDGCPRNEGAAKDIGASEVALPEFAGTGEDFELHVTISGAAPPTACGAIQPIDVAPGDDVSMTMISPFGGLVGVVPVLAGQLFVTGAPPSNAFPGVHLDPNANPAPFIVFDGNSVGGLFAPFHLPAGGLTIQGVIPALAGGQSVIVQAFGLGPTTANGSLAASDGVELRF